MQTLSPLVLVLAPVGLLFFVAGVADLQLSDGSAAVGSLLSSAAFLFNPLFDAMATLYFVGPYKRALLKLLGFNQKKAAATNNPNVAAGPKRTGRATTRQLAAQQGNRQMNVVHD